MEGPATTVPPVFFVEHTCTLARRGGRCEKRGGGAMPSLFFFFSLSPRGTGRKELCPPPFVGRGGRGSLCLFDPLWPPFFLSLFPPEGSERERGPPRMQALPFRPLLLTSLSPCPPPPERGGWGSGAVASEGYRGRGPDRLGRLSCTQPAPFSESFK